MNLKKRRGKINFSPEILHEGSVDQLKIIFSNFYPYDFDPYSYPKISMIGYSEHFRELKTNEPTPEYVMKFRRFESESQKILFDGMEEIYD